jgi:hypothetical protein
MAHFTFYWCSESHLGFDKVFGFGHHQRVDLHGRRHHRSEMNLFAAVCDVPFVRAVRSVVRRAVNTVEKRLK